MWWKLKNQILILIKIVLVVVIIGGGFTYFTVAKPSSCFDGVKNGDEHGIDCSGSCVLYCSEEVGEPKIIEQGFVSPEKGKFQFYAHVSIPFSRAITAKSLWSVDILDTDKHSILKEPLEIKGYITTDRQTYIISDSIELNKQPVYVFWKLKSSTPFYRPVDTFSNASLKIKNSLMTGNDLYTVIDGSVMHEQKNETYNFVDIIVLLYNDDDKVYALSKQRMERLEFNKEYPIHITFLKSTLKQKPARFTIIPQIIPMGFFK